MIVIFMMCLNVEIFMRMKSMSLLSMSLFNKIKVSLSSLLSERLHREMSFFMNCSICFVIEVLCEDEVNIIVVDAKEATERDVILYELFNLFCC